MIILLSAAVGFVAFYVARIVYAVLDRNVTYGRLVYIGGGATLLYYGVTADSVLGDDPRIAIGYLMLSIATYIVATTVLRLVEAATELINLRHLIDRPRR